MTYFGAMWLLDRLLRRLVTKGELTVTTHDGKRYRYGSPHPELNSVEVRFTDRRVPGEILHDASLGIAEAYMNGRLILERGDIRDLIMLGRSNVPWDDGDTLTHEGPLKHALAWVLSRIEQLNSRGQAKKHAEHTYNITPRIFELFLDQDRQYSCAYYADPTGPLDQAQLAKKAHIAAKLDLKPGMKVLDIGCGWGGLALYLAREFDVEVLGVSLASEQIAVCKERAAAEGHGDKVRFEIADYRDLAGPFDRIVSVGMFEHVGTPNYPTFFRKCRELLAEDGVMLLHTIGRLTGPGTGDRFIGKYIFPGGYIPALSEMVEVTERQRLMVSDVEILRYHYAYTLHEWYRRANANRDEIVALSGERFFRMWQFYLAGCEIMFSHGPLVNFQIQYLRSRDAMPITRDYMVEGERELLRRKSRDNGQDNEKPVALEKRSA